MPKIVSHEIKPVTAYRLLRKETVIHCDGRADGGIGVVGNFPALEMAERVQHALADQDCVVAVTANTGAAS